MESPKAGDEFDYETGHINLYIKTQLDNEGTSLGFVIHKNVPEADKASTPGPEGVVFSHTIEYPNYLNGQFWNLKTLACLSNEQPQQCPIQLAPGAYRIEAILYNKRKSPLVGKDKLTSSSIVANAYSGEFKIIQLYSKQDPRIKLLDDAASYKLAKLIVVDNFEGMNLLQHLDSQQTLRTGKDGLACKKYIAHFPLTGTILACIKDNTTENIQVGGNVTYNRAVVSYTEAKQIAIKRLQEKYGSRADFIEQPSPEKIKDPEMFRQATYLSINTIKWNYKQWWSFAFRIAKAGGSPKGSDRFDDIAIVVVGNEKWSCIYHTGPYKNNSMIDLNTDGCGRFSPKL